MSPKAYIYSDEWVKFKFWANYLLFEAFAGESENDLEAAGRQLHSRIWISTGNTNSGGDLVSCTEPREFSPRPVNWPYVTLQTRAAADGCSDMGRLRCAALIWTIM